MAYINTASLSLNYDIGEDITAVAHADALADGWWAGGTSGRLYRTVDGLNWAEIPTYSNSNADVTTGPITSIFVTSDGLTVYFLRPTPKMELWKSTDAGATWAIVPNPAYNYLAPLTETTRTTTDSGFIAGKPDGSKVYFVWNNSLNIHPEGIYGSIDGGGTWVLEHSYTGSEAVRGITVGSDASAVAVMDSVGPGSPASGFFIARCPAGGGFGTWVRELANGTGALHDTSVTAWSCARASDTEVFAWTIPKTVTGSRIYRSTDGGVTWAAFTPAGGPYLSIRVGWANASHVYLATTRISDRAGEIQHTTDRATWTVENRILQVNDDVTVSITNPWRHHWMAGFAGTNEIFAYYTPPAVVPTTSGSAVDQNHLWFRAAIGAPTAEIWRPWVGVPALVAIHGASASEVYAGGMWGLLYKWNGSSWANISKPWLNAWSTRETVAHITAIHVRAAGDVYVAYGYSKWRGVSTTAVVARNFPSWIERSIDGGGTWAVEHTLNHTVREFWASSTADIWAVGGNLYASNATFYLGRYPFTGSGFVVRTDGAGTWAAVAGGAMNYGFMTTIFGPNASNVWAFGGDDSQNGDGTGVHRGDAAGLTPVGYVAQPSTRAQFQGTHITQVTHGTMMSPTVALLAQSSGQGIAVRAPVTGPWSVEWGWAAHSTQTARFIWKAGATAYYAVSGGRSPFFEAWGYAGILFSAGDRAWYEITPAVFAHVAFATMWSPDNNTFWAVGKGTPIVRTAAGTGTGLAIGTWTGLPSTTPKLLITGSTKTAHTWHSWTELGPNITTRHDSGAVVLTTGPNAGKVFAFGGTNQVTPTGTGLATCELFNPATNTWSAATSAPTPFEDPDWVTLADGRILVIKGEGYLYTPVGDPYHYGYIYDPVTNTWSTTAKNNTRLIEGYYARGMHLMGDGRVLFLQSKAVYNPATNTWAQFKWTFKYPFIRASIRLANGPHAGKIFAVGNVINSEGHSGYVLSPTRNWAGLFDETTFTWTAVQMPLSGDGSINSSLTELSDGRVIFTSDTNGAASTLQIYYPSEDVWRVTSLARGAIGPAHMFPIVMGDGTVLMANSGNGQDVDTYYDPSHNSFIPTYHSPELSLDGHVNYFPSYAHFIKLPDNSVLRFGGRNTYYGEGFNSARLLPAAAPTGLVWKGAPNTATRHLREWNVHNAHVTLDNGDILLVGTNGNSFTDRYISAEDRWVVDSVLNHPRVEGATVTKLLDGRVLVVGGWAYTQLGPDITASTTTDLRLAEVYDPGTKTWSYVGSLNIGRTFHQATLIVGGANNGKVVITGGYTASGVGFFGTPTNTVELFDPGTNTFSTLGTMPTAEAGHITMSACDGKLISIGGPGSNAVSVWDPNTDTWESKTPLSYTRTQNLRATMLSNEKVLVYNGEDPAEPAELIDTAENSFSITTINAYPTVGVMENYASVLLADGRLLLAGGFDWEDEDYANDIVPIKNKTWFFNPATNSFTAGPDMLLGRSRFILIPLGDKVLAVGGLQDDDGEGTAFVEELTIDTVEVPFVVGSCTHADPLNMVVNVVATDLLELVFQEDLKNDDNLKATSSYTISAASSGARTLTIRDVLTGDDTTTKKVYLVVSPPTRGAYYDVTIGATVLTALGENPEATTARFKSRATKVDSIVSTRPGNYAVYPRANLRHLINAIGYADEQIGGDRDEGDDIVR